MERRSSPVPLFHKAPGQSQINQPKADCENQTAMPGMLPLPGKEPGEL
jgi:hypothetical protein